MPNMIYGVWWVGPTKRRLGRRAGRLFVGPTHQTPYIILGILLGILFGVLLGILLIHGKVNLILGDSPSCDLPSSIYALDKQTIHKEPTGNS